MKKVLLISFLIFISANYAQNENFINSYTNTFSSQVNDINKQKQQFNKVNFMSDVIFLTSKEVKLNSDGKFLINQKTKEHFENVSSKKTVTNKNVHLSADNMQEFIENIILQKLESALEKLAFNNESLTYGDRNIEVYRNYQNLRDKLIASQKIANNIEIQTGNNLYPYINKIQKTELDKTLQNSLNLLAINF